MRNLNLLIKPASSSCNLRCKYCFYYDVADNREVKNFGIMNDETLENMVKRVFEDVEYSANFAFQGGEPTVAGIEYFKSSLPIGSLPNKFCVSFIVKPPDVFMLL